ncbi:MAG: MBL fold metallo-hydrolase [Bacteroidetes bacterium]|nr:MBL fold metallo-hydrolase [Bacteroidota bacterium]
MKIFFHFSVVGFSNTYLIGNSGGGDAILIDPGHMDIELLKLIEENNYYIKHILLTHRHPSHTEGLRTLRKIYDSEIYANSPFIMDCKVKTLSDESSITLSGIPVSASLVPGHSSDSLVYKIQDALFTGDVLMSGRIGSTNSSLSRSLLIRSIQEKILPLNDNTLIFPGHGTPTTLFVEKMINPILKPE